MKNMFINKNSVQLHLHVNKMKSVSVVSVAKHEIKSDLFSISQTSVGF